jgi:hypothetical protein
VKKEREMPRGKGTTNGHLEEALAALIQNQASFVARMSESDQRFNRIEALLNEHGRILVDLTHAVAEISRRLDVQTEAIREKIGFKSSTQTPSS